jgi:TorA maturation chaperone TorD
MTAERTIRVLLADCGRQAERREARAAWARKTAAAWHEMMQQMDDRCTKAVERLSEEEFDRLFEAEQAKVDAIYAQLRAVIDKDRWPKELYWGGV